MNEEDQNKDPEQKIVRGIPFKDFLDKSANIIVILGIFNALLIYSTTVEKKEAAAFMTMGFFFLSILMWWELIDFTLASSDGGRKYTLFYYLLATTGVGLAWYAIYHYLVFIVALSLYALFVAFIFLYAIIFGLIWKRYSNRFSPKKSKLISWIIIILCFSLGSMSAKLTSPIVKPVVNFLLQNIDHKKDI